MCVSIHHPSFIECPRILEIFKFIVLEILGHSRLGQRELTVQIDFENLHNMCCLLQVMIEDGERSQVRSSSLHEIDQFVADVF